MSKIYNYTIDNFNYIINERINNLKTTIEFLKLLNIADFTPNLILEQIDELYTKYTIDTIDILNDHYNMKGRASEAISQTITESFFNAILTHGYIAELNEISRKVCDFGDRYIKTALNKHHIKKLQDLTAKISHTITVTSESAKSIDICDTCGEQMHIHGVKSELSCSNCGDVINVVSVAFEDVQIYNQDVQKTKHGTYVPNRHFRTWRECIHAEERKTFNPDSLRKIELALQRDKVPRQSLDCQLMRNYLKECQLTTLNDNVPSLVKHFSNGLKTPPKFTLEENRHIEMKFNLAMQLYERVKGDDDSNRPFYPYFYYKICQDEFDEWPAIVGKSGEIKLPAQRRNVVKLEILKWIHLQSRETVIKHDILYQKICEISEDRLRYKPT